MSAPAPGKDGAVTALVPALVRATEDAALAAAGWRGRGAEKDADRAAVDAMRRALGTAPMAGRVVIGEGERDQAPMLFIGEEVGTGKGPAVDIAVDPLEGTTICARDAPGALAVLAAAPAGGLLHAPDVYMDKIAAGPGLPAGVLDIDDPPAANLARLAEARGRGLGDLTVCVLDRPRHEERIRAVREAGARVRLIPDGDIAAVILVAAEDAPVDLYLGSGGAPEGVLAAAALACTGGQMFGRLLFRDDDERARAEKAGIGDPDRVYGRDELAAGEVAFVATGVTDGPILAGVRPGEGGTVTETLVLLAPSGERKTVRATRPAGGAP